MGLSVGVLPALVLSAEKQRWLWGPQESVIEVVLLPRAAFGLGER